MVVELSNLYTWLTSGSGFSLKWENGYTTLAPGDVFNFPYFQILQFFMYVYLIIFPSELSLIKMKGLVFLKKKPNYAFNYKESQRIAPK